MCVWRRETNEMLSHGLFLFILLEAQEIKNITPFSSVLFYELGDVIFNGIARGFKQLFYGQ